MLRLTASALLPRSLVFDDASIDKAGIGCWSECNMDAFDRFPPVIAASRVVRLLQNAMEANKKFGQHPQTLVQHVNDMSS